MNDTRPVLPTHFRSFTTVDWRDSRQRFQNETSVIMRDYSVFKSCKMFTEEDLCDDFWSKSVYKNWSSPGHSFYAWKPYILLKALREIPDGEVLFYADGGCNFRTDSKQVLDGFFKKFCNLVDETATPANPNTDTPRLSLSTFGKDSCASDCCISLLDFFGLRDDQGFYKKFPHYEAGVIVMRKTHANIRFVETWWGYMRDHLDEIFKNTKEGLPGYWHNSCDQAVMQALLYKTGASIVRSNELFYDYGFTARYRG